MKKHCLRAKKFKFLYLAICFNVVLCTPIEVNKELIEQEVRAKSCKSQLKKKVQPKQLPEIKKINNRDVALQQFKTVDVKHEPTVPAHAEKKVIALQEHISSIDPLPLPQKKTCSSPMADPTKTVPKTLKKNDKIRTITFSNNITKDMITYKKHWSGNHCPEFSLLVNGVEVKDKDSVQISLKDDQCNIEYRYNFKVGKICYRSGGESIKYKISKDISHINSTFSWDNPNKLIMENAELVSKREI